MSTSARLTRSSHRPIAPLHDDAYDFADLNLQWDHYNHPVFYFQRGEIFAFQHQAAVYVFKFGKSGIFEQRVKVDLAAGAYYELDYELSQDEESLFIASAAYEKGVEPESHVLQVLEVRLTDHDFGETTPHIRIKIPIYGPKFITLCDPYLATNRVIIDWRKKRGAQLGVLASSEVNGDVGADLNEGIELTEPVAVNEDVAGAEAVVDGVVGEDDTSDEDDESDQAHTSDEEAAFDEVAEPQQANYWAAGNDWDEDDASDHEDDSDDGEEEEEDEGPQDHRRFIEVEENSFHP